MTDERPGRDLTLPVRTDRLVLRQLRPDDLDRHAEIYGDPAVMRYLLVDVIDREHIGEHLAGRLTSTLPEDDGFVCVGIEDDGRLVGEGFVFHRGLGQYEVGYLLHPDEAGRGYATEAARALVAAAFAELGAHRVFGRLDARNDASANVLRRLGMRQEAHLRENAWVKGEWTDELVFAITESEWTSPAPASPAPASPAPAGVEVGGGS